MHRLNSLVAWLRTPRLIYLAVDRVDDKSHSSREVSSVARFSTKHKQTVWSNCSPPPEYSDLLPPGVFHVENAQQTRWLDLFVDLKPPSRRRDSETGIARCCAALPRRGNWNRFVALVARVQRTAGDGSQGTMHVPGTPLHPETRRRLCGLLSSFSSAPCGMNYTRAFDS